MTNKGCPHSIGILGFSEFSKFPEVWSHFVSKVWISPSNDRQILSHRKIIYTVGETPLTQFETVFVKSGIPFVHIEKKWSIRFFIDVFSTFMMKADFTKRILSPSSENLSCETILKHVERK